MTINEDADAARRIDEVAADVVWVGLGPPKQDRWIAEHVGQLTEGRGVVLDHTVVPGHQALTLQPMPTGSRGPLGVRLHFPDEGGGRPVISGHCARVRSNEWPQAVADRLDIVGAVEAARTSDSGVDARIG
jgi:hypothetical protein